MKERIRGSSTTARLVASDPVKLQAARADLEADFFAKTTRPSKTAKRTFAEVLAILAGHEEIYPLTEEVVLGVAAALKSANYLARGSGSSYLAELREGHIKRKWPVEPWLELPLKRARTSMERGGGPPEKAADGDPRVLAGGSPRETGPQAQQARRSAVIASWWRLREIEQAGIRLHVTHCKVIRDGAQKKARTR